MKRMMVVLLAVTMTGCGVALPAVQSERGLSRLSVGETRGDVQTALGSPDVTRTGDMSGVQDEYRLYPTAQVWNQLLFGLPTLTYSWFFPWTGTKKTYVLTYEGTKLAKWSKE